jgi:hypothetical protein
MYFPLPPMLIFHCRKREAPVRSLDSYLRKDTFRWSNKPLSTLSAWRDIYSQFSFDTDRCLLISSIVTGPPSRSATETASLRSAIRSRLVKGPLEAAARVSAQESIKCYSSFLWNAYRELYEEIQRHAIPADIMSSEQKIAEFHRQMVSSLVERKASSQLMPGGLQMKQLEETLFLTNSCVLGA